MPPEVGNELFSDIRQSKDLNCQAAFSAVNLQSRGDSRCKLAHHLDGGT